MNNIQNHFRYIITKVFTIFLVGACFLSVSYLAIAANDSVQIKQTVGEEGDGTIIPPEEEGVGGGIVLPINATPPESFGLKIYDIGLHSAKISFQTNEICLAELYYGKSKIYDLSSPSNSPDSFESAHEFFLKDLESGSKYYLKVIIKNQKGVTNMITDYSFYTTAEFKNVPAVGSLTAVQEGRTVVLDWNNPAVADFQGVQISRQTGFPPLGPDQGEKIFFGLADKFVDTDVSDDTKYYYTLFAFDAGGKFSPGVTISIKTNFPDNIPSGAGNGGNVDKPGGTVTSSGSETQTIPVETAPIKDVRNLQASADVAGKKINLSWEYAELLAASEVEIRRDLNFPSISPLEGELIYQGDGSSFGDSNVKKGQIYFYTVFVKNIGGKYSGGSMIAAELKESATEPSESSQWQDMSFVDVNSGISLLIQSKNEINVLQGSILGISYGVEDLPANLVAVAIQLGSSSYLLDYDEDGSAYRTSFVVPETPGEYSFDVVFLNAENEVFFEKDMKLKVLSRGEIFTFKKEALFGGEISFAHILCHLGNLLGGENQDCMTRKAIDGAEVTIFKKNEDEIWEVWNAKEFKQENPFMTDGSGRYGTYLSDGEYEVGVKKDGFEYRKTEKTVANNILSENIQIYVKKDIRYGIILLATLFTLVTLKREKKISRHRKK